MAQDTAQSEDGSNDALASQVASLASQLSDLQATIAQLAKERDDSKKQIDGLTNSLNEEVGRRSGEATDHEWDAKSDLRRHRIDLDELFRRIGGLELATSNTTNTGTSDQIAIVTLIKTGGSPGDADNACSFVYTMTTPTSSQPSTAPSWVRGEAGKRNEATQGLAFRRAGQTAWTLAIAFEPCDTGHCFTE